MMHLTSVILLSIACWYTVSATTNTNDKNAKVSDLSINELTSIINSLVDKSLQQHNHQQQQQIPQQPQGPILETIEDEEAMPLEPLNSFNFYPSNLQDIIRPDKRGTFQFYGARGKKSASSGFNFGTLESKRFNYMPSRG